MQEIVVDSARVHNFAENGIPIRIDHLRGLAGIAEKLDVPICWEWQA